MSLNKHQLDALVALIAESLRTRKGDVLDDLVIVERARNIAALLDIVYDVRPRPEHDDGNGTSGTAGEEQ